LGRTRRVDVACQLIIDNFDQAVVRVTGHKLD
jgi:hypothetical protein